MIRSSLEQQGRVTAVFSFVSFAVHNGAQAF
jgi:hypothetical protein